MRFNIWWFVITPMSLGWLFPLLAMREAGAPARAYVLMALAWLAVAAFAGWLYDRATALGRRLGHERMAALRERLAPRVLPPARAALLLMAGMSAAFAALA